MKKQSHALEKKSKEAISANADFFMIFDREAVQERLHKDGWGNDYNLKALAIHLNRYIVTLNVDLGHGARLFSPVDHAPIYDYTSKPREAATWAKRRPLVIVLDGVRQHYDSSYPLSSP